MGVMGGDNGVWNVYPNVLHERHILTVEMTRSGKANKVG